LRKKSVGGRREDGHRSSVPEREGLEGLHGSGPGALIARGPEGGPMPGTARGGLGPMIASWVQD